VSESIASESAGEHGGERSFATRLAMTGAAPSNGNVMTARGGATKTEATALIARL